MKQIINKWNQQFDINEGDLISCFPYPEAFYEVFGFDNYEDTNIVSIVDGTSLGTRHLTDVVAVKLKKIEEPKRKWKKKRSRIEKALQSKRKIM